MPDQRPIDPSLLPACASVDNGSLALGSRSVADLVAEFGSPLFVYDLDEIQGNFQEAYREFGDGVAYATKAFLSGDIVCAALDADLSLDVSTEGEYDLVRACGFPAHRIAVHGNNKSQQLIDRAVAEGVQWLVIDNRDDIRLVAEACQRYSTTAQAVVRVNPGIEVHTHEYYATGNRGSKFGFPTWTEEAEGAVEEVRRSDHLRFRGLHTHIGSLVYSLSNFEHGLEALEAIVKYAGPEVVIAGGGLGVRYLNSDTAPTFADWAKTIRGALERLSFQGDVLVEPGRAMVAKTAITIYTVGSVRDIDGQTVVAVDGGMSDNPRPVLYQSGYEAFLTDAVNESRPISARIVGSHCESGDTLVSEGILQRVPARGGHLATPVTGAYGYSMASNYNRMRRPAVVFISAGEARLGIARESFADLRRNDQFFSGREA